MVDKKYIIILRRKNWDDGLGLRNCYYGGSRGSETNPEEFLIPTPRISRAEVYNTSHDARTVKDTIGDEHVPIIATVTKKQLFEAGLKGK